MNQIIAEPEQSSVHDKKFGSWQGFSSGITKGETPVPIPNTAVKPFEADGSAGVILCESRKLLGLIIKARILNYASLFLLFRLRFHPHFAGNRKFLYNFLLLQGIHSHRLLMSLCSISNVVM